MQFFKDLVKDIDDENTHFMKDGLHSAEFSGYVNTGSYNLNAVLSASIYGGAPNNKIIGLAGDPATGKTFFTIAIVEQWLKDNLDGAVFWYDTEAAVTLAMLEERGIDTSRIVIAEPSTIEQFRSHAMNVLIKYQEHKKDKRPPMLMVLDSLGMLSTEKEMSDIISDKRNKETGEAVRDMTKPGLIRGAFRALRLNLARSNVAMIVTCHTYAAIGSMSFDKEIGGGCLTAGIRILTKRGFVAIEDVKVGDEVYTKEGEYKEVVDTFHFKKPTYEIEFEDGYVVKCSPDHRFLVYRDSGYTWVKAKDLKETDEAETV